MPVSVDKDGEPYHNNRQFHIQDPQMHKLRRIVVGVSGSAELEVSIQGASCGSGGERDDARYTGGLGLHATPVHMC